MSTMKKVPSLVKADRLWELQKVEASIILRQSAHKGGNVVSPDTVRLYPTEKIAGTYFC